MTKMNHSQRLNRPYKNTGLEHIDENNQANRIRIRNLIAEKCEFAKRLPPRQKLLFLMYYDHGHTLKEIAELCGIDEATVGRSLRMVEKKINNMSETEA
jgi:RNA polymerase sigma factor (sigma-70 family)